MTGNPSERDDMDFDDDDELVIDPDVDPSEPPHPLDEVFAEVDRELAKRRGMWTDSEAKLNDAESAFDDEDVFVLEEEGLEMMTDEESSGLTPLAAPEVPVHEEPAFEVPVLEEEEEEETELRVRTDGPLEAFSADKSMFDLDVSPETMEPSLAVRSESAGSRTHEESEGEMSVIEEIDASSTELEIIEEAPDPFARLGEAGASDAATSAFDAADRGEAWTAAEDASASQPLEETTWDEAQAEATAAAFAEELGGDEQGADGSFDEPTDEDDFDPIYGDQEQADADAAAFAAAESEPDFADYEETYAEAEPAMVVIGAPIRARRRGLRMLIAAAVLLIAAGGTLAMARPDLIGLGEPTRLIDRVEIARPTIDTDVTAPIMPPVVEPTPVPVVVVDPVEPTPPVVPPVEPPPVEPVPVVPLPDPVLPPPVAVDPTPSVIPTVVVTGDTSRIGEDLVVRAAEAPVRGRVHELADGIATGNQAFAQLKNLNFFVGRVKAMDANVITLTLDPGEVTLAFEELTAIVPLASEEYRMMQGGQESFVRLRNSNKLFGRILANGGVADNIVIEVQKNLVTIPRHAIEEIGGQSLLGVQVLQDDGGDWVERMLRKKHAETGLTAVPPGGAVPPAPAK